MPSICKPLRALCSPLHDKRCSWCLGAAWAVPRWSGAERSLGSNLLYVFSYSVSEPVRRKHFLWTGHSSLPCLSPSSPALRPSRVSPWLVAWAAGTVLPHLPCPECRVVENVGCSLSFILVLQERLLTSPATLKRFLHLSQLQRLHPGNAGHKATLHEVK